MAQRLLLTTSLALLLWTLHAALRDAPTASALIARTEAKRATIQELLTTLVDAETGQRGYLLTGAPAYLEPYDRAIERWELLLVRARRLTADQPAQQRRLDDVERLARLKLREMNDTIRLREQSSFDAALSVVRAGQGKEVMDEIRAEVAAMQDEEEREVRARTAALAARERSAFWTLLASSSAVIVTAGCALVTRREARRRERELTKVRDALSRGLEEAFKHAPIGLVFFDQEGRYLRVNPELARINGLPAEAMIGKTIREVSPAYAPQVERYLCHVFTTGEVVRDVELSGPAAAHSGEIRHHAVSYFPIQDSAGRVLCVAGIGVDVTEQKRVEVELRASSMRLARLWESNIIGVGYGEPNGDIVDANDAFLQMLGYTAEDLRARRVNWRDLTPPEYGPLDERGIAECRARGACTPYEKVYLGKHGRRVPILIGLARLEGPGPEYIAFVVDQTERAQLLEGERFARAEAERACRIKDEFIATVSHELRTPLSAVLGWSQLLQRPGGMPDRLARGLGIIERNAHQLAQIVSDLLDVSRMVAGKARLDLAPVDVRAVIEATLEGVRGAAEDKGITLDAACDREGGLWVVGDAGRLQQVIGNLASNAVKFTPAGGRVEIRAARVGDRVVITVRDTGEGIDAEFLPHVFDRFRQADASAARRHAGLGLGLAIVKGLTEMHGGVVRAESDGRDRGATFTVELPAAAPAAEGSPEVCDAPDRSSSVEGLRVLVVEDEPDARELTERILGERGATVVAASSALDALDLLPRHHPDVVVSDIGMPGMDGSELIRQIRTNQVEDLRDVPAIALTAFARPEDRARLLAAGFQAHLGKPFEAADLIALVAQVARHGHSGVDCQSHSP
ncbi:MAG: CHASE3 domain-containing protein [Minicystis sp.]